MPRCFAGEPPPKQTRKAASQLPGARRAVSSNRLPDMEAPPRVRTEGLDPERLTIAALRVHLSSVPAIAGSTARPRSSIDARPLQLSVGTANPTRPAPVAAPAAIRLRGVPPFRELPVPGVHIP